MTRTLDDWHDEWAPEHPVQVAWNDDSPDQYLSLDHAIERLTDGNDDDKPLTRQYLEAGSPMAGRWGTYRLQGGKS